MRLRQATAADLDRLTALEAASYPADEAASRESLAARIAQAPECFLLAEDDAGDLLGFVCGTRSVDDTLTHANMGRHDPGGASLCVHSVVVAAPHRRRGVGGALLGRARRGVLVRAAGGQKGSHHSDYGMNASCQRQLLRTSFRV